MCVRAWYSALETWLTASASEMEAYELGFVVGNAPKIVEDGKLSVDQLNSLGSVVNALGALCALVCNTDLKLKHGPKRMQEMYRFRVINSPK